MLTSLSCEVNCSSFWYTVEVRMEGRAMSTGLHKAVLSLLASSVRVSGWNSGRRRKLHPARHACALPHICDLMTW